MMMYYFIKQSQGQVKVEHPGSLLKKGTIIIQEKKWGISHITNLELVLFITQWLNYRF